MNRFLLFVLCLTAYFQVSRAQIPTPNPGFENWTQVGNHYDPDNWNTLNPSTSVVGILSATRATGADVHSGSYAIKLTTKLVFNIIANGIATTGTLIVTPPYGITGGIPFTGRPDSIAGWYKCTAQPGDTGFVEFSLLGANNDTIGYVRWWAPTAAVGTYARFSKAITYFSAATPVTSQWILSSSKGTNQLVNSMIIIDDLELITNPVGLPEYKNENSIRVYPSITDGHLSVVNDSGKKIRFYLFNTLGMKISGQEFNETMNLFNFQGIPGAMYLFKVVNENGELMKTGKVIFQ